VVTAEVHAGSRDGEIVVINDAPLLGFSPERKEAM
jgi:hypothetical protein